MNDDLHSILIDRQNRLETKIDRLYDKINDIKLKIAVIAAIVGAGAGKVFDAIPFLNQVN